MCVCGVELGDGLLRLGGRGGGRGRGRTAQTGDGAGVGRLALRLGLLQRLVEFVRRVGARRHHLGLRRVVPWKRQHASQ